MITVIFGTVQAPLGLVMLVVTGFVGAVFAAYALWLQASVLVETRRMTRELASQRQLADQARHWGPAWVVGAVGVAIPGLTRMAARLSYGAPELAEDIDSEMLAGFLQALRVGPIDPPRIWLRLCWAAWRAGLSARRNDTTVELPADLPTGGSAPRRPYGHPDLILGRAVVAGIITRAQADLIGATRLGDVLVEQIAAEQGVCPSVIRMRRKRAERRLVRALAHGELSGRSSVPEPRQPASARHGC